MHSDFGSDITAFTDEQAAILLPTRDKNCHKGLCGTAGLLVGNVGYSGAAVIAGRAAVKSGVGIANMIIPNRIYDIIGCSLPEAVCTVLGCDSYEEMQNDESPRITTTLNNCTAGLIGCGLGQSKNIKSIIKNVLSTCIIPLVIDADGINVLSDCIELVKEYKSDIVLTPHPKEASRILGCSVESIQNDRLSAVKKIVAKTNAVTVLKGANTLVCSPSGKTFVINDGNPSMATAGTGDMLSGMIVAFIAQGLSAENAAVLSAKLHAVAGDMAFNCSSLLSLTPSDMIDQLPILYKKFYSMK